VKKSTSIFDRVAYAINVLFALLLIVTGLISYVPLQIFAAISVLSLVVPFLFALNALFFLYWAIQFKRRFILSLLAMGFGYLMFGPFYGFDKAEPYQETASDLKIMSYNVWGFNKNGWMPDAGIGDSIIELVEKVNPDILCVQEHNRRRNKQLQQYPYRSETPNFNRRATQAIFSKYPIVNNGSLDLPHTQNNIIYADILFQMDTVRVYNLHLQSFKLKPSTDNFTDGEKSERTYKRLVSTFAKQLEQAEIFREHFNKSPYVNIVCGDLNNTQFSNIYKIVKGDLQDSFLEMGKGWGRTYDFVKLPLRIDYIMADENVEVLSHQNFDKRLSDHYPVMATLRLKSHQ
jgi:endonuclease/exonuclease/phosphatase family metal-dependent hydrolase